jgi:hypothetical protein
MTVLGLFGLRTSREYAGVAQTTTHVETTIPGTTPTQDLSGQLFLQGPRGVVYDVAASPRIDHPELMSRTECHADRIAQLSWSLARRANPADRSAVRAELMHGLIQAVEYVQSSQSIRLQLLNGTEVRLTVVA